MRADDRDGREHERGEEDPRAVRRPDPGADRPRDRRHRRERRPRLRPGETATTIASRSGRMVRPRRDRRRSTQRRRQLRSRCIALAGSARMQRRAICSSVGRAPGARADERSPFHQLGHPPQHRRRIGTERMLAGRQLRGEDAEREDVGARVDRSRRRAAPAPCSRACRPPCPPASAASWSACASGRGRARQAEVEDLHPAVSARA